jgi:hypothetical protein
MEILMRMSDQSKRYYREIAAGFAMDAKIDAKMAQTISRDGVWYERVKATNPLLCCIECIAAGNERLCLSLPDSTCDSGLVRFEEVTL